MNEAFSANQLESHLCSVWQYAKLGASALCTGTLRATLGPFLVSYLAIFASVMQPRPYIISLPDRTNKLAAIATKASKPLIITTPHYRSADLARDTDGILPDCSHVVPLVVIY